MTSYAKPFSLYGTNLHFDLNNSKKRSFLLKKIYNKYLPEYNNYKDLDMSFMGKMIYNNAIILVIKKIADSNNYVIENSEDILQFITQNEYELFNPKGKYFNSIYNKLKDTSELGNKIEDISKSIFIEYARSKNIDIELLNPNVEEDKRGIDIYFILNNKKYTIQVKTLNRIIENNEYYVYISGHYTNISTNYVIFTNSKSISYIFKAKGISHDSVNNRYVIPLENLLYSKNSSKPIIN
jgi:hypothetical protein